MRIEVKVFPVREPKSNILAFAHITIDGKITIRNVSVVNGSNGMFTSMPQEKDKDGNYREIVHIVNREVYNDINQAVLGAYIVKVQGTGGGKQGGGGAPLPPEPEATDAYQDPEFPY